MTFEDLDLIEPIRKALKEQNYVSPTPIQEQAIPIILKRQDVLGSAQTGTGKTAAFAIPVIQNLALDQQKSNGPRSIKALIITPTRELAIQIGDSFRNYGKYTNLRGTVIFGGVKAHKQIQVLKKGVDILVATPGRLLDLNQQGYISLDEIQYFVLDEADRMLDMGFIHDIKRIIKLLPQKRQSLFFSATMPDNIVALSRNILHKPKKIEVSVVSSAAETVQQYVYFTNKSSKRELLIHILDNKEMDQVLLFSRTKHGANKIVRNLQKFKIKAAAIHGDKAQNQRQKALKQFKAGELRVLVATDIAARGIDIDKLRFVINYDIPNISETYVHRIGRSGRAGEEGIAISISEPEENAYVRDIEKLIKQKLKIIQDNPYPQTDKPMTAAEKKEFEKEKNRKRQEFFAERRAKKNNFRSGPPSSRSNKSSGSKKSRGNRKSTGFRGKR